jgi:hypothetical protein
LGGFGSNLEVFLFIRRQNRPSSYVFWEVITITPIFHPLGEQPALCEAAPDWSLEPLLLFRAPLILIYFTKRAALMILQ